MNNPRGTVLVVDDQELIRDLLERLLRASRHQVLTAPSGAKALTMLRDHPVDLILLDIMMPGMSGIEVLQQVKANQATADLPVVVISADSNVEQIAACLIMGAEDYVVKPFNAVLLDARVNACLEKRRLRAQEHAYRLSLEDQVAERTALAEQRAAALERSERELRRQSTILRSTLDSMGDAVVVVDTHGHLTLHNPAAELILGPNLSALAPASAGEQDIFLSDQALPCPTDELPLALALRGQAVDGMELLVDAGDERGRQWLSVTARPLLESPYSISGGVAVVRDISAAKRAELTLRESEERYALAARGANDGLWDWDLRAERVYFSPRWKAMLGYSEEEIGLSLNEWLERVHQDDRERLEARLAAHCRRLISHFEHEYRIKHRDGSYRWMLCRGLAVWGPMGEAVRMAGSQTEITDRKLVEQQLMHDALHDGLTGLPNRALFIDRLDHALSRSKRTPEERFAVLFLDLDRFKLINDSLGHTTGDQLLIAIAKLLEDSIRPGDTVARLGGDEFTILLEAIPDQAMAVQVAERLLTSLSRPLRLGVQDVYTTASIGIVMGDESYGSAADMIRDADTAMYHAKAGGKAQAMIFDPAMHAAAMSLLQLESDLRRALERDELRLHYQPIVTLEQGHIVGLEALLRWQHPLRGLLAPAEFLGLAEETGLIVPIGWWVLEEACRQMKAWQDTSPGAAKLWLTVNLAEKQLAQSDVLARISGALSATGLPASSLKLEITEHTLLAFGDATVSTLRQIRELGVQLCIDDFGTGYSSLSYLQRFPVDVLKIDRSFIQQLNAHGEHSEIVQTIIALANVLNLQAVAEGTETIEQVKTLRELHCQYGQGWLFSKALDPDAVRALVDAEHPLL